MKVESTISTAKDNSEGKKRMFSIQQKGRIRLTGNECAFQKALLK